MVNNQGPLSLFLNSSFLSNYNLIIYFFTYVNLIERLFCVINKRKGKKNKRRLFLGDGETTTRVTISMTATKGIV